MKYVQFNLLFLILNLLTSGIFVVSEYLTEMYVVVFCMCANISNFEKS